MAISSREMMTGASLYRQQLSPELLDRAESYLMPTESTGSKVEERDNIPARVLKRVKGKEVSEIASRGQHHAITNQ
jgi:hypothetical protein